MPLAAPSQLLNERKTLGEKTGSGFYKSVGHVGEMKQPAHLPVTALSCHYPACNKHLPTG